uniref:Retrotransposon gag domain-containing protein n=1 Tax=Tanacetum cinerariifolium TaxID=118510 RepID=A0A6L2KJB9_TANCI|nr:hypothetical protein [Tanacetum cinerariifolium]
MSSDSASSEVMYTSISSLGEPLAWAANFFGLQERDSSEAAPASPDYEILIEDQPYVVVDSPIALSTGYVADSDPKEDPKEDPEDDDEDEDEDEEPFEDEDDDEEEEHLAPVDSPVVPVIDPVPSAEDTKAFETDEAAPTPVPSPRRYTARMSVRPQTPIPWPSEAEVERLLALPIPPPSPLTPLLSSLLQIPSPLLPHVPTSLPLPLSPLPPLPASLSIPSPVDRREDTSEAELPPRKRLCLNALTLRYEVGESSAAAPRPTGGHRLDYGFIGMMDAEVRRQRAKEVGYGIRDVWVDPTETVEEDTQDIYVVIEDTQDSTNGQGDGSHNSNTGTRGNVRTPRECTYKDFLNCKPLTFKGTEGVVVLTQWFEKMESVFHISNCAVENQVKFATCTFFGNALTWWNSHIKAVTQDVAYAMDWKTLRKMMTDKYCPRGELKKLEIELWNLKVKDTDVTSYTLRFQELALMCGRMFHEESEEVEKYVGGLPDMIRGNVMSYQPKTMAKAIEFANDQMDQKVLTISERQAEQKKKMELNAGNNQRYQQQNKRQNSGRAYTAGPGEKREHTGFIAFMYQGHFKKDCPKLKNGNPGNQRGNGNALAKVYVVGNAGTNPDSNVVTGTFLLNNLYASILFDTSADRSFVSTTFSSLIDITPTTLDHYYDVKLADRKIIRINTIIQGCTLNFLNHPFNINLMPIELGSFDVIIGMDWLSKYHVVIDCAEKIVRIPWGNETLLVYGDGSNQGNETHLNIISYTKTH